MRTLGIHSTEPFPLRVGCAAAHSNGVNQANFRPIDKPMERVVSHSYFETCGRESVRERLRKSASIIVGMAVAAFFLGFVTTVTLTPKATIAGQSDIFSGRLVRDVAL